MLCFEGVVSNVAEFARVTTFVVLPGLTIWWLSTYEWGFQIVGISSVPEESVNALEALFSVSKFVNTYADPL